MPGTSLRVEMDGLETGEMFEREMNASYLNPHRVGNGPGSEVVVSFTQFRALDERRGVLTLSPHFPARRVAGHARVLLSSASESRSSDVKAYVRTWQMHKGAAYLKPHQSFLVDTNSEYILGGTVMLHDPMDLLDIWWP